MSSFRFDFGASGAAPAAPGAQAAVDAAAAPPPQPPRGVSTRLEAVNASDPLQLFPGIPPTLLATLSAPSVLRAGVCCKRWREVTQRVVMRRTADGAGPASVSLLVKSEDCEEGSEVACALGALTRTLAWAPEVALIFATEDAACYSDGSGLRTLEEDVRARLPRACLVACGRAPGVFGPVAGAPPTRIVRRRWFTFPSACVNFEMVQADGTQDGSHWYRNSAFCGGPLSRSYELKQVFHEDGAPGPFHDAFLERGHAAYLMTR